MSQYTFFDIPIIILSFVFSGTSVDGKSILPSIEPTDHECEILHSFVRKNVHSLLEYHCPKVFLRNFPIRRESRIYIYLRS
jgi:Zn finger protein HypA/HybF involved in hydrogenase expression